MRHVINNYDSKFINSEAMDKTENLRYLIHIKEVKSFLKTNKEPKKTPKL